MAVIWAQYQPQKASGDGAARESHNLSETWLVRVDVPPPATATAAIIAAPGVWYGSPHPSFAGCKATRWSYSAVDGSGLLWAVTVNYSVPLVEIDPATGLPMDVWGGTGAMTSVPFYKDKAGKFLENSAGDPVEGLEKEVCEIGYTLTRSYPTIDAAGAAMKAVINRTNSDAWATGAIDEWKCTVNSFSKKHIIKQSGAVQTVVYYWEVNYEFAFKAGTWHAKPWDMGFNEKVDANGQPSAAGTKRRVIPTADGRPVKKPVFLASGVAIGPGVEPQALDFDPYEKVAFTTTFGVPG